VSLDASLDAPTVVPVGTSFLCGLMTWLVFIRRCLARLLARRRGHPRQVVSVGLSTLRVSPLLFGLERGNPLLKACCLAAAHVAFVPRFLSRSLFLLQLDGQPRVLAPQLADFGTQGNQLSCYAFRHACIMPSNVH
jgi:hypothetical protein